MSRDHIISVRITLAEHTRLRMIAEGRGVSVSDWLRRHISDELAPPPPRGESVGSPYRLVEAGPGRLSSEGVVWADGTVGSTFTSTAA